MREDFLEPRLADDMQAGREQRLRSGRAFFVCEEIDLDQPPGHGAARDTELLMQWDDLFQIERLSLGYRAGPVPDGVLVEHQRIWVGAAEVKSPRIVKYKGRRYAKGLFKTLPQ